MEPTQEKAEYIEQVGLMYEQYGLPRMAGRILGYLLVCDSGHASFDDLVVALRASKGAISQSLLLLTNQFMIVPVPVPNDRRKYYKFSESQVYSIIGDRVKAIHGFRDLFKRALDLQKTDNQPRSQKLREVIHFYNWLEGEMELLRLRWQAERERLQKEGPTYSSR
jgi:DNA-binding transcriptional regulator GbsR (MarR family)